MLESLTKKQKIIFFIILSIMILFIIYYLYYNLYFNDLNIFEEKPLITNDVIINNNISNIPNITEQTEDLIVVYICGAVQESKVVTLKENSRVCDAIDAAGGLSKDADLTDINLAYILEDAEKIYIPKKGEEYKVNYNSSDNTNSSNKININKASQAELETIPGIGPSTALKIINYRETNGKFSKIEDIKNVTGIGDSKYNNIKEYITIK